MGAGFHGGFGDTLYSNRVGQPVDSIIKTYEMALNPIVYAVSIANKYRIHLKSASNDIKIVYNPNIPDGVYGRISVLQPNVIEIGKYALQDEFSLANTIAHELSHSRDILNGRPISEDKAYNSGDSLESFMRGER